MHQAEIGYRQALAFYLADYSLVHLTSVEDAMSVLFDYKETLIFWRCL